MKIKGRDITLINMEQIQKDSVNFPTTPPLGLLSNKRLTYVTKPGESLGKGSAGAIYGYIIPPSTQIAVKFTKNDDYHFKDNTLVRRLDPIHIHEAAVIAEIGHHPNVIKLLDIFTYSDGIGIVIPRMSTSLKRFKGLTFNLAIIFSYQIALGLDYIHSNHWIHADLKPENILVDNEGKNVVIADFGFAKIAPDCETREWNRPEGYTPRYAAPEIALGLGQDYEIDIWSYGCIIFYLFYRGYLFNPRYPKENVKGNQKEKESTIIKFAFLVDIYHALGLPSSMKWKEGMQATYYKKSLSIYNTYRTVELEDKEHETDFHGEPFAFRIKKLREFLTKKKKNEKDIDSIVNLISGCIKLIPERRLTTKEILNSPLFSSFNETSTQNITCADFITTKEFPIPKIENKEKIKFIDRSLSILEYMSDRLMDSGAYMALIFADYAVIDTNIQQRKISYTQLLKEAREIKRALVDRKYTQLQPLNILDIVIMNTQCKLYSSNSYDILHHIRNPDTEDEDDLNLLLLIYITDAPFFFSQLDISIASWVCGDILLSSPILKLLESNDLEERAEKVLSHVLRYIKKLNDADYKKIDIAFKKITDISIEDFLDEIGIDDNNDMEYSDDEDQTSTDISSNNDNT